MILLEESWSELFLICAIQFCLPMDNCALFSTAQFGQQMTNAANGGGGAGGGGGGDPKSPHASSTGDLRFLNELVQRFRILAVDPAEFACLKAVILFKQETRGLKVTFILKLISAQL